MTQDIGRGKEERRPIISFQYWRRRFANASLRGKLTISFLMVSVLSVLIISFSTNYITSAALTRQLGANLNSLAHTQALATGDLLARQIDALQALSLNRVLRDRARARNITYTDEPAAIRNQLEALNEEWQASSDSSLLVQAPLNNIAANELQIFQELFPDHVEVLITDEYGALAAAATRPEQYYYADETWWQQAYKGGEGAVFIGLPLFDAENDAFSLVMAVPLFDNENEKVIGVLQTIYRLTNLMALIKPETEALQVDLLLPDDSLLNVDEGQLESLSPFVLEELQNTTEESYALLPIEGSDSLVSHVPIRAITGEQVIADLGWEVFVHQAQRAALAPVVAQQRVMVLLTLLIIGIAAAAATWLARLLSQPIIRLTRTALSVVEGNLDARAAVETQDEIGTLARTFNEMTDHLRIMIGNLENANEELEQFAYVVSHDLKAPLRAITNLSEWLEEDLGDMLNDETREYLDLMRQRVERMRALIDGVLEYSRAGRTQTQLEEVDVGELLTETVDWLQPPDTFSIEIETNMPVLVTERVKLGQVFANLIGNAIKYHHRPDGRVNVSAKDNGRFCEFTVADDGPGIAEEYHKKVFGIFQMLQSHDEIDSTGVGLAMVKKIVEGQGGEIWLESAEGQGATFRFTWPKRPLENDTF